MAKRTTQTRRPSILLPLLLVLLLPLVLLGGTLGTLMAMGVELPFFARLEPPALRIPANPRPIAAYSRVSRNDLINLETGQIHYMKMPPRSAIGAQMKGTTLQGEAVEGRVVAVETKEIEGNSYPVFLLDNQVEIPLPNVDEVGGAYLQLGQIIGRVVDREKSANFGFTESNFLPEGTRAGNVGGVPQGMKAYTLEAGKLVGVHGLNVGDKVDLLASVVVDKLSAGGALANGSVLPSELLVNGNGNTRRGDERREPRLVASDAQVIAPVYRRSRTTTSSSLIDGTSTRTTPVEEVVLAVYERDIPAVTEALSLDVPITVVAHSGRPSLAEQESSPEGMVRVPVTPRETVPYTKIRKAHLVPSGAARVQTILLSEQQVQQLGIITDEAEILGRVVRRAIAPGSFFTEADFFAPGTMPGLKAAIPDGMVAFTVDAAKIDGIAGLSLGDEFDLIATRPVDYEKMAQRIGAKDFVVSSAIRSGALRLNAAAQSVVVAHRVVAIAPPGSVALSAHGTALSGNGRDKLQPMVIALKPEEVPRLNEALTTETSLTAVLRGERQQDETAIPDSPDPAQSVRVLDSLLGKSREPIVFVTDASNQPAKPLNLQDLLPPPAAEAAPEEAQ